MCPGNHESAGKRQSGKTRKGSPWLRALLVQAAHAAARTKGTYLAAQYRRLAARRGKSRAAVAVGHTILVIAFHLLRRRHRPTTTSVHATSTSETASRSNGGWSTGCATSATG